MDLPVFEIFIEDTDNIGIALVDFPAIDRDFIYFDKDEKVKMEFNEEKMIVKGPALIPNKLMYKGSNNNFPDRLVYYSKSTIEKFVELLLNKKENKFNLSHTENFIEANIIESYFAKEPNEFGVPEGSWIVSARIKDFDVWQKIKSGEFSAFSVEGLFSYELVEFAEHFNKNKKSKMNELKEKIFNAINNILFDEKPASDPVEFNEEIKEEIVGEIKEEVVEDQEVIEGTIEEVEDVVEKPVEEVFNAETVKAMMEEFKSSMLDELAKRLGEKVEEMKKEMVDVKAKVEEFSKQPITESILTDVAANVKIDKQSKAASFFSRKE